MKNLAIALLLMCLSIDSLVLAQENKDNLRKTLLIDAGHGGMDSGAIGTNGLKEKDVVIEVAKAMVLWNSELFNDTFDIYLTRSSDTLISLSDRTKLAKHLNPDVFISIHANHAPNRNAKGIEVFTFNGFEAMNEIKQESQELAYWISREISNELGLRERGIRNANFQVLRDTKDTCPAVLVELGFMSNKEESVYLENAVKRNALALALLVAIKKSLHQSN